MLLDLPCTDDDLLCVPAVGTGQRAVFWLEDQVCATARTMITMYLFRLIQLGGYLHDLSLTG
jgi:hypothetical protein